jgi:hypothetical protein
LLVYQLQNVIKQFSSKMINFKRGCAEKFGVNRLRIADWKR